MISGRMAPPRILPTRQPTNSPGTAAGVKTYACANCMLIATHFNNTLLVDMREFDDVLGGKTTIDQLISRDGVTKIRLMGDASFFRWW